MSFMDNLSSPAALATCRALSKATLARARDAVAPVDGPALGRFPQEGFQLFPFLPGQFLTFEIPWDGLRLHRCYSLSSAPGIRFCTKISACAASRRITSCPFFSCQLTAMPYLLRFKTE